MLAQSVLACRRRLLVLRRLVDLQASTDQGQSPAWVQAQYQENPKVGELGRPRRVREPALGRRRGPGPEAPFDTRQGVSRGWSRPMKRALEHQHHQRRRPHPQTQSPRLQLLQLHRLQIPQQPVVPKIQPRTRAGVVVGLEAGGLNRGKDGGTEEVLDLGTRRPSESCVRGRQGPRRPGAFESGRISHRKNLLLGLLALPVVVAPFERQDGRRKPSART
mmetsp:Transcript_45555/g.98358  ORF Transcript_45555/g.98358 Transcript_45555/m.98358 type:complete len:219 (+) Transcript_45555:268-924(+)